MCTSARVNEACTSSSIYIIQSFLHLDSSIFVANRKIFVDELLFFPRTSLFFLSLCVVFCRTVIRSFAVVLLQARIFTTFFFRLTLWTKRLVTTSHICRPFQNRANGCSLWRNTFSMDVPIKGNIIFRVSDASNVCQKKYSSVFWGVTKPL